MAKILLVEDDQSVRSMLRIALKQMGHHVFEAGNGKEAIACHEREPVAVMLTDIVMPEKEGLETILEFRRRFPQVKVIAMSGGGSVPPAVYLKTAKSMGASHVLAKPFSNDELAATLEQVLQPGD